MYKPIPEEAKYAQLIKDIKQYVADENNWNYIKPNEDYTTYSIGKSSEIFYFGTYHIKDSQDQLVEILTNEFDRFINQYGENTIFLIEDWLTQIYINKKEAIEKRGERGLLMYLGQRFNVQITPIDYDRSEIFNILDSTFDVEAVDLFAYLYLVKSKLDKEKTELKDYKKNLKNIQKAVLTG